MGKEKTSPLHRPSPFSMPQGLDKELSMLFGDGKVIGKPHRATSKPHWCDGSCCYPIYGSCNRPQQGWRKVVNCIFDLCIIMLLAYMVYFCCCCGGSERDEPAQILVINGGGNPPAPHPSPSPRADVGNFGRSASEADLSASEVIPMSQPVQVAELAERPLLADNLVSRTSLQDVRITVPEILNLEIETDTTTPRPDDVAKVFVQASQ